MVTKAIVENTLCEMYRIWKSFLSSKRCKELMKSTSSTFALMDYCFNSESIQEQTDTQVPSVSDNIYIYRNRH